MRRDKIFLFLIIILIGISFFVFDLSRYNRDDFFFEKIIPQQPICSKGIYITFRTAGSERINEILDLIKNTELNTVVIDVKDFTGHIGFYTQSELLHQIGSERNYVSDMEGLVERFHKQGIYTIARIAVFQDDYLSRKRTDLALKRPNGNLWLDNKSLGWLDPISQEAWDYNLEVAKEAVKAGFDEINLDYIRFPSDGDIGSIVYPFWNYETPKKEIIRQFFEYFSQRIKPSGVYLSADLFGLTLTSPNDLNIGQWLEDAALYFDYICPMVYPSHYPPTFLGFENPAQYPYEVIYDALKIGNERLASISSGAKLRPWLQDFDLGAIYDANMINLEKKAVYDANAFGWLLWNPKNVYTEEGLENE